MTVGTGGAHLSLRLPFLGRSILLGEDRIEIESEGYRQFLREVVYQRFRWTALDQCWQEQLPPGHSFLVAR